LKVAYIYVQNDTFHAMYSLVLN